MSQRTSNTKDDFQVVVLLSCFVGHPVPWPFNMWVATKNGSDWFIRVDLYFMQTNRHRDRPTLYRYIVTALPYMVSFPLNPLLLFKEKPVQECWEKNEYYFSKGMCLLFLATWNYIQYFEICTGSQLEPGFGGSVQRGLNSLNLAALTRSVHWITVLYNKIDKQTLKWIIS